MRKEVDFIVLGNNYRTKQLPAALGVELLCEDFDPTKILSTTEVYTSEGWIELKGRGAIDRFVSDSAGLIAPMMVLDALCGKVYEINFGFLAKWRPVNIPKRLVASINSELESSRMDPVISLVVMADKASIKELEEYYSTEDAFKMYDMIAVDNLNKALGSEAAMNEAKSKKRR